MSGTAPVNLAGMAEAQERIDLLLNEIEERCQASDYEGSRVPFMLDCASLSQSRMPARAAKALETARAFSAHEVPLASVHEVIKECWRELDQEVVDRSRDDPNACAIRAVICILSEQSQPESGDFVNLLSFFLNLLNQADPHPEEQILLINKHFSGCLGS